MIEELEIVMRPGKWTDEWPLVDGASGSSPSFWDRYEALRDELDGAVDFYERCQSVGVKGMYRNYIHSIQRQIDVLC